MISSSFGADPLNLLPLLLIIAMPTHMVCHLHTFLNLTNYLFWTWNWVTQVTPSLPKIILSLLWATHFLHHSSCHYPKWIQNIPKGLFCRFRQNCTIDTDYDKQSLLLKKKFLDIQYPEDLVDKACEFYSKGKPPKTVREPIDHSTRIITAFHY